jgi:hypothetical protein
MDSVIPVAICPCRVLPNIDVNEATIRLRKTSISMKISPTIVAALALFGMPLLSMAQFVGIGTMNPMEKLHVAGNLRVDGLLGVDTRLVAADVNGTLVEIVNGSTGQVLTQTVTGPAWMSPSEWAIQGNAGTNVATDFVGTTDAMGLVFRTGNIERARFTTNGLLCVNGTAPIGTDKFSAYAAGGDWAVNGYASGNGDAGFFYTTGTGTAVVGQAVGSSGSAAEFLTLSAAPSASPTVYMYNGSANAPIISMRGDVANSASHGIALDMNGASNQRGIQVDMDAANTGVGVAVLHFGANHALSLQSFNAANTVTALLADHAGNARSIAARTYLTTGSSQTAFFVQSSSGLIPATYSNATAVWGQSDGIRGGAFLSAGPSSGNTVLQAVYNGVGGNYDGVGVYGVFQPAVNYGYGVVGQGNWYGVYANGNLGASGVKSFMIDHPLDPENKYLRHFSVESPEVLNLYRGTVILDANGEADVQLPSYFHAVNVDFSYNLTPVGSAASLFISEEVDASGNFRIAGGHAAQKVCWNVYAQRNDPFVQQNPESISVEPMKRSHNAGLYLQPSLYGQPEELGVFEQNKVRPEKIALEQSPEVLANRDVPLPSTKPLKGQD